MFEVIGTEGSWAIKNTVTGYLARNGKVFASKEEAEVSMDQLALGAASNVAKALATGNHAIHITLQPEMQEAVDGAARRLTGT